MAAWFRIAHLGRLLTGRRGTPNADGHSRYVEVLSEKLYQRTLGEGGGAVDIGVFGPALFQGDARRLIHEITLGSAAGGPPSP